MPKSGFAANQSFAHNFSDGGRCGGCGHQWLAVLAGVWTAYRRGRLVTPWHRDLLAVGVLALATLGFFWRVVAGQNWMPADGGDLVSFLYPTYRFTAAALADGAGLVVLDGTVTPELEAEGWAKDRIRELQELRKSTGLDVSDRISVVMSVPLIAFSHAITATLAAPDGRAAIPAAIAGATNFRMCAPTAVVTMSAEAIAAVSSSACLAELRAEYPRTTVVRGSSPTSCTAYESEFASASISASSTCSIGSPPVSTT